MVATHHSMISVGFRRFARFCCMLIAIAVLLGGTTSIAFAQARGWSGVGPSRFQPYYRSQEQQTWCWAACIEMVLDYHGPNVNQNAIVRQVYGSDWNGRAPDAPASFAQVQGLLNQWGIDDDGDRFWVQATGAPGAPPPAWLDGELRNECPIIVLFFPAGPQLGHFVVVAGRYFDGRQITRLHIWDPYPYFQVGMRPPPFYTPVNGQPGCYEVPADVFMRTVRYHIFSRAVEDQGFDWPDY